MRKAIFALSVAVAISSANASYLYWQIDTSEASGLVSEPYTGARVFASTDGGAASRVYLDLGYGDYDTGAFQTLGTAVQVPLYDSVVAVVDSSTLGGDPSGYSFYIELINYSVWDANKDASSIASGAFVAQSDGESVMTYSNLVDSKYIGADLSPVSMAVWHGGSYTTVPEPTSAMLVLFGLAGLALKRRTA